MRYGDALRLELLRQGKTQKWVAEHLGVTTAAVNKWVKCQSKVPEKRQEEIEVLLGWKPDTKVDLSTAGELMLGLDSPMAWMLRVGVPDKLVSKRYNPYLHVGTAEYVEWALGIWSDYLAVSDEYLVNVALRKDFITLPMLGVIFGTGMKLTYLGEHLGERIPEAEQVLAWLDGARHTVRTWEELRARANVANSEAVTMRPMRPGEGRAAALALLEGEVSHADPIYEMAKEMKADG